MLKMKIATQATKMNELTEVFMSAQKKYKRQLTMYKQNYVRKKEGDQQDEQQYEDDSVDESLDVHQDKGEDGEE